MTGNGKFLPPIKMVIVHSYVSSQHRARATGNETSDFAFLYEIFWGGHANVPVNLLTSSMLREHQGGVKGMLPCVYIYRYLHRYIYTYIHVYIYCKWQQLQLEEMDGNFDSDLM